MIFQLPLAVLIGQALLTLCLICVSVYEKPHELGVCLLLLLIAVPVYVVFVMLPKPAVCIHFFGKLRGKRRRRMVMMIMMMMMMILDESR
jgi:hypothetical protein